VPSGERSVIISRRDFRELVASFVSHYSFFLLLCYSQH